MRHLTTCFFFLVQFCSRPYGVVNKCTLSRSDLWWTTKCWVLTWVSEHACKSHSFRAALSAMLEMPREGREKEGRKEGPGRNFPFPHSVHRHGGGLRCVLVQPVQRQCSSRRTSNGQYVECLLERSCPIKRACVRGCWATLYPPMCACACLHAYLSVFFFLLASETTI